MDTQLLSQVVMLRVNQQAGARPVEGSVQLTGLVRRGDEEVEVGLGLRGEAEVVEERRVAAASARSLGEECMVVDVFG